MPRLAPGCQGGARAPERPRERSGLGDGDDEAGGSEDVADADALGLRRDLDHGLARVVDLPGDLPAVLLGACDRPHELPDDLLEGVTVTVVKDGHPGRGLRRLDDLGRPGLGLGPGDLCVGHPGHSARASSAAARSNVVAPYSMSSIGVNSSSQWLRPPRDGTKIIPAGPTVARYWASCPAPDRSRRWRVPAARPPSPSGLFGTGGGPAGAWVPRIVTRDQEIGTMPSTTPTE